MVVTGETQTAMVDAAISASRRLLFILVFHFYLILDLQVHTTYYLSLFYPIQPLSVIFD